MAFKKNDDYVEVAERIQEFKALYPHGSLQTIGSELYHVGEKTFIATTAAAYRTPEDTRPGIGSAWEPIPGLTPYTKNSELQNAETSAWGRAIVAVGIPSKHVASANEVRNRQGSDSAPKADKAKPAGNGNGNGKAATAAQVKALLELAALKGRTAAQVATALKKKADYGGPLEKAPAALVEAISAGLATLPDAAAPESLAPAPAAQPAPEPADAVSVDPVTGEVIDGEAEEVNELDLALGGPPTPTLLNDSQMKRIAALLRLRGIDEQTWRGHMRDKFGAESRKELTVGQAQMFIKWIENAG
jgi:hypothetical protein